MITLPSPLIISKYDADKYMVTVRIPTEDFDRTVCFFTSTSVRDPYSIVTLPTGNTEDALRLAISYLIRFLEFQPYLSDNARTFLQNLSKETLIPLVLVTEPPKDYYALWMDVNNRSLELAQEIKSQKDENISTNHRVVENLKVAAEHYIQKQPQRERDADEERFYSWMGDNRR